MFRHCKDDTISIPRNSQTPSKIIDSRIVPTLTNDIKEHVYTKYWFHKYPTSVSADARIKDIMF